MLGYLPFSGTDLLQVAAHEFGHVLGLQHTTAAKALMSPFYTFRYPLSLSPDDRRGIQHLYGQPRPAPTSRPPAVGPQAGVDDNEIAPLEVRPCSQLPSLFGLCGSNVGSCSAFLSHTSRKCHQMPARSPLMQSPPSVASSSSSKWALCGGCVGAGCSLATLHWLLVTGRDCPALWMQPLKMPRATSGSSKVRGTGVHAQETSGARNIMAQGRDSQADMMGSAKGEYDSLLWAQLGGSQRRWLSRWEQDRRHYTVDCASMHSTLKAILGGMCDQYACSRDEISGKYRWYSDSLTSQFGKGRAGI